MKFVLKSILGFALSCVIFSCSNFNQNFAANDFVFDLNPVVKQIEKAAVSDSASEKDSEDLKIVANFSSIKMPSLNRSLQLNSSSPNSSKINFGKIKVGSVFDLSLELKIYFNNQISIYKGNVPTVKILSSNTVVAINLTYVSGKELDLGDIFDDAPGGDVDDDDDDDIGGGDGGDGDIDVPGSNVPADGQVKDDSGNVFLDYEESDDGLKLEINWVNGSEILKLGFIEESATGNKYLPTVELEKKILAEKNNSYTYPFIDKGGKYKVSFVFQTGDYKNVLETSEEISISNSNQGIGSIYVENVELSEFTLQSKPDSSIVKISFDYKSTIPDYLDMIHNSSNTYGFFEVRPLKDKNEVWDFAGWFRAGHIEGYEKSYEKYINFDKSTLNDTNGSPLITELGIWKTTNNSELTQGSTIYFQIDYKIAFHYADGYDYFLPIIVSDQSSTTLDGKTIFVYNEIEGADKVTISLKK